MCKMKADKMVVFRTILLKGCTLYYHTVFCIHFVQKYIIVPTHWLLLGKNMSLWYGCICFWLNLASKVCAYVLGEGVCMCFAKKPKWGHFLPVINQGLDNLSLNLSYLLLSILSLSLFSQGRVENALSSEIHFAFRQFASFHVIVLLLWVCFLRKRNSSGKPWSPIVSVLIG